MTSCDKDETQSKSCSKLVEVKTTQESFGKRIEGVEDLYKPVNRLTTLFVIVSLLIGCFLTISAYLWVQIDGIKTEASIYNYEHVREMAEIKTDILNALHDLKLGMREADLKNQRLTLDILSLKSDLKERK